MIRPCLVLVLLLGASAGLNAQPAVQAQKLTSQAAALESKKLFPKAIEAMADAVKLQPQNEAYLGYLAKLQGLSGKHEDSLKSINRAIDLNRGNIPYYAMGMRAALKSKNYEIASEYSTKVLANAKKATPADLNEAQAILKWAEPRRTDKILGEAVLLHQEGKLKESLGKVKEALAKDPKNPTFEAYAKELQNAIVLDQLDRKALDTPPEMERSLESLGIHLARQAPGDRDRARLIFRWIADRVRYDPESLLPGKRGDNTSEGSLKLRKCVCEGYSNLFVSLAKVAGLEAVYVRGWSKGGEPGSDTKEPRHAWNAVKIDGKWQLLDMTWGAGTVKNGVFTKRLNDFYFLTPPELFVLSHLPVDFQWQLLETRVQPEEFQRWGKVNSMILAAGAPLDKVRQIIRDPSPPPLVEMSFVPGPQVRFLEVPLERSVKAGAPLTIKLRAANFQSLSLYHEGKLVQRFFKTGDVFEGDIIAPRGEFMVMGKPWDSDSKYNSILRYQGE